MAGLLEPPKGGHVVAKTIQLGVLTRSLAPFCHPDPLPGGSYKPVPATSSFEPLLGRVLRLSELHNRSTMGAQGPNAVPPSAYGHYVPIFMGWPRPQGPWGIFPPVWKSSTSCRLFEKETERGVGAMRSKDGKAARDYEM